MTFTCLHLHYAEKAPGIINNYATHSLSTRVYCSTINWPGHEADSSSPTQSCKVECIYLAWCAYTQGYPYTLHLYICMSMPISWSTFTQTLLYSTKCSTVTLHLPFYFVKYADHGKELDELLPLIFLVLAQQPDNKSWTLHPPPPHQVLRDVMFYGKKSVPCPTPNLEYQVSIFMTPEAG